MIPDVEFVQKYLGDTSWSEEQITDAFLAEMKAQENVCKIPVNDSDPENPVVDYPEDLAEALCRRVSHNLAVRALPLGIQQTVTEMSAAQMRVGGTDAEVRRLEGPYRKRVVG